MRDGSASFRFQAGFNASTSRQGIEYLPSPPAVPTSSLGSDDKHNVCPRGVFEVCRLVAKAETRSDMQDNCLCCLSCAQLGEALRVGAKQTLHVTGIY